MAPECSFEPLLEGDQAAGQGTLQPRRLRLPPDGYICENTAMVSHLNK